MRTTCGRVLGTAAVVVMVIGVSVFGAGGTDILARKGKKASVSEGWPKGAGDLVNDPARTTGWRWWFTEMHNDSSSFAFEVENTEDLNRLLEKLAAMQCETKQLWLDWRRNADVNESVPGLGKGNRVAAVLMIADQLEHDRYLEYKKREPRLYSDWPFPDEPQVGPPMMRIHVRNPAVDLEKLRVPKGVTVKNQPIKSGAVLKGDPAAVEAQRRIDAFLKRRGEGSEEKGVHE